MKIDEIRSLFESKKTSLNDEKRINNLEFLFKHDDIFFKLDKDTAYGILKFLGIDVEKIEDVYLELISPTEYQKLLERIYSSETKNRN